MSVSALTPLLWTLIMWVYIAIAFVIGSKVQWYDWLIVVTYTIFSVCYMSYKWFNLIYNPKKSIR